MIKGDLATTPLPDLLRELAAQELTGCLHVVGEDGDEALVHLKAGLVYALTAPGRRPQLGDRLISSGVLGPDELEEALEAQATELSGWRLGELLVHLGYVEREVIEAFVAEQVRDAGYDLAGWTAGAYRFRRNERTRDDVATPVTVEQLLADVDSRAARLDVITTEVHGPDAVPTLSAGGIADPQLSIDPDAWSLLCKVDGSRSVADLARDCGFTLFEASSVVYRLVQDGLLEVDDGPAEPELYDGEPAAAADVDAVEGPAQPFATADDEAASGSADVAASDFADVAQALRRTLAEEPCADLVPVDDFAPVADLALHRVSRRHAADDDPAAAVHDSSITPVVDEQAQSRWFPPLAGVTTGPDEEDPVARVSAALSALLGPVMTPDELTLLAARAPAPAATPRVEVADPGEATDQADRVDDDQAERVRLAAEAELEAAQAEAEQAAAAAQQAERIESEQAAAAAERAEAQRAEAERIEAEQAADEAQRIAAERAAAEQAATEAEQAAVEAEWAEAQRAEAERIEAEQATAEAQRIEAERAAEQEPVWPDAADEVLDPADISPDEAPAWTDAAVLPASTFADVQGADVQAAGGSGWPRSFDVPPAHLPEPAMAGHSGFADTASLLRELSSLQLDDDPSPPGPPAQRTPPRPLAEKPKKRKGLFGR